MSYKDNNRKILGMYEIISCTGKYLSHDDNFIVAKYDPDNGNDVIIVHKNEICANNWASYTPIMGLYLDNIYIGTNIFNLDINNYDKIQKNSLPSLPEKICEDKIDRIEQIISDHPIKIIDGMFCLNGCGEIHHISMQGQSITAGGAFADIFKFFPCTNLRPSEDIYTKCGGNMYISK
jgi:hypothetical protein